MVKIKDYLELFMIVAGIIGIVLRIAQIKADIYTQIDNSKDEISLKLNEIRHDMAIHLTEYAARKENYGDKFHGIDEALKHKFDRCWDKIKEHDKSLDEQKIAIINNSNDIKPLTKLPELVQQIQGFLQKYNFNARSNLE